MSYEASMKRSLTNNALNVSYPFKNSFVILEGNTKEISTMTVTLYLIKLIDVRKIFDKILTNIGFYIKLSSYNWQLNVKTKNNQ